MAQLVCTRPGYLPTPGYYPELSPNPGIHSEVSAGWDQGTSQQVPDLVKDMPGPGAGPKSVGTHTAQEVENAALQGQTP